MSIINNSVQAFAGLVCTALSSPPIGVGVTAQTIGFTEGEKASDEYIKVLDTATPLNADLVGDGLLLILNPGPLPVLLKSGSTTIGSIPAPATVAAGQNFAVLIPIASGVIINATVSAGSQSIGRTLIKTTVNAA